MTYYHAYTWHDDYEDSSLFAQLLVESPVPADDMPPYTTIHPGEEPVTLSLVATWDHEPTPAELDVITPFGYRSTDPK